MSINILLGAVSQGLLWAVLAIGVYITYKILDIADLTTEGSFPLGAVICARFIMVGYNPFVATLFSIIAGIVAGLITGLLHTKLKIPALLSGILVMLGLYSVNLRVADKKPNLPLLKHDTIITQISNTGVSTQTAVLIVGIVTVVIVVLLLFLFFRTELGFAVRATGNNIEMIRALGVNTDTMKILGLVISNALISLSGALIAQYNGYFDVGMGIGTIVIGLASVIIGEVLFGHRNILHSLISVTLGSILYRIIIAYVLKHGLEPIDLKLVSSVFLAIFLAFPVISPAFTRFLRKLGIQPKSKQKNLSERSVKVDA